MKITRIDTDMNNTTKMKKAKVKLKFKCLVTLKTNIMCKNNINIMNGMKTGKHTLYSYRFKNNKVKNA